MCVSSGIVLLKGGPADYNNASAQESSQVSFNLRARVVLCYLVSMIGQTLKDEGTWTSKIDTYN